MGKDVEEIVPKCTDAIRELIALGFVWPVQQSAQQAATGETSGDQDDPTADRQTGSPTLRIGKSSKPNFITRTVSDFLNRRKVG
jgi:hypothetical protein